MCDLSMTATGSGPSLLGLVPWWVWPTAVVAAVAAPVVAVVAQVATLLLPVLIVAASVIGAAVMIDVARHGSHPPRDLGLPELSAGARARIDAGDLDLIEVTSRVRQAVER
jgi:hypothetical protein